MTDTPTTAEVATPKAKVTDIERLEALAVKIAKSIVKNPLTETVSEKLHDVAALLFSTVNHSQTLEAHTKLVSEHESKSAE